MSASFLDHLGHSLEDPDLPELELERRREKRKPYELD